MDDNLAVAVKRCRSLFCGRRCQAPDQDQEGKEEFIVTAQYPKPAAGCINTICQNSSGTRTQLKPRALPGLLGCELGFRTSLVLT